MKNVEKLPGNQAEYDIRNITPNGNSPLNGKHVIFLGSSVTFGAASMEQSFVEVLAAKDGLIPLKEAVSGTTLVDDVHDGSSYLERMKKLDRSFSADLFVCQLSTNDATQQKPIGRISDEPYDTATIAGAIQEVVAYAKDTWNCPVVFYTGTRYDSDLYGEMVHLLAKIAEKMGIKVIDLWNNEEMSTVTEEEYDLYMADGIHPTKAGYLLWWSPKIEKGLLEAIR